MVEQSGEEIFHLALPQDWADAKDAGDYRISTRGLTLAQVGFIHCSRADQWPQTRTRFYADVPDLLLLRIDPARLTSPLRVEPADGDWFPHVHGPLDLDAVIEVTRI